MFKDIDELIGKINELMKENEIDIAHINISNLNWFLTRHEEKEKIKNLFLNHFQKPNIHPSSREFIDTLLIEKFSMDSLIKTNYDTIYSRPYKIIEIVDQILLKLKENEPTVFIDRTINGRDAYIVKTFVFFGVSESIEMDFIDEQVLKIKARDKEKIMNIESFDIEEIYKELEKTIHSIYYDNRTKSLFTPRYYHTNKFFYESIKENEIREVLKEKLKELIPNLELERLIAKTREKFRLKSQELLISNDFRIIWYSIGEHQFLIEQKRVKIIKLNYLGTNKENAKEFCLLRYRELIELEFKKNEKRLIEEIDIDNKIKEKRGII